MITTFEFFEKFSIINLNHSNNNFQRENDDILSNQNNNSIQCSTHINKNIGINTLIKPFDLLVDQDYSEMNSNINSTDLRLLYLDKDLGLKDYKHDNNKVVSYKFKIKKAKNKKKSKQSLNDNGNKIFSIKKIMKLGRIKKNSNKRGKHDKYKRDNIIRRFKVHLMKSIYEYINSLFLFNKNGKNKKRILKKLCSLDTKSISKRDNIKWLNSTIRNVFSKNITSRLSKYNRDYNKKLIGLIYEQNIELDVITLLNKTIREMWLVYINNDSDKSYNGFSTLKDDITQLKEMGEPESYIKHYISIATRFEDIFDEIISRK